MALGYITSFYSPYNERIRKRKAFADQDLMNSTLNCYYRQIPSTLSSTAAHSQPQAISNLLNVNSDVICESKTRSSKISFSIESIIGIK